MINEGNWKPTTIKQFWDYVSSQPHSRNLSFSNLAGKGVFEFLKESGSLSDGLTALDFGCGSGFLLEHLLSHGLICYGVDSSPEQIVAVNKKFSDNSLWEGAKEAFYPPLPFSDASFDLITCVEVLEHLLPDLQEAIPLEIFRLLKPGGKALFTTPNNEDLDINKVYCPFCDTRFHRRQHLRSFTSEELFENLKVLGFDVIFCDSVNFNALQTPLFNVTWKSWDMRFFVRSLRFIRNAVTDYLAPKQFPDGRVFASRLERNPKSPHLCALVEK